MSKYQNIESEIVNLYKSGNSQYKIAKQFKISFSAVYRILLRNNVEIRKGNQNKKHFCNDNYFELIDSPTKAYLIGFLTADGNISKRDNQISIGLSSIDKDHLIKIKNELLLTNNIIDYNHNLNGKIYPVSLLCWTSAQMKKDLSKHGIIPNKSKITVFSQYIPEQFLNSYILGLYDGDGSYHYMNNEQMQVGITGTYNLLYGIQNVLVAKCNLNLNKIIKDKRCDNTYYLNFGGHNSIIRLANYLYKNNNIFLQRKYDIIKPFINKTPNTKLLNILQENDIINKYKSGNYTQKELSLIYKVSRGTISNVIHKYPSNNIDSANA